MIVISLGGSVINPGTIDKVFLKAFTSLIEEKVENEHRFVIVCGGGAVARQYIAALPEGLSEGQKDMVGIEPTWLNARLIAVYLQDLCSQVIPRHFDQLIGQLEHRPVAVCGGFLPALKTDEDAAIVADYFGAYSLLNVTNVDGVYTKDPTKFSDAKRFDKMTYKEFFDLFWGEGIGAGANAPFTLIATKIAERANMPIVVLSKDLDGIRKAIENPFAPDIGTIIHG
ncbi:MAG: UMP kinase [Candidatus Hodarchaeales archaeon]|jgi:uridylate kinase